MHLFCSDLLVSCTEAEDQSGTRPAKEPKTSEIIENEVIQRESKEEKADTASYGEKEHSNSGTEETSNSRDIQPSKSCAEQVQFRVVWNKKNYEVTFGLNETADSLKQHIENLTGSIKNDPLYI